MSALEVLRRARALLERGWSEPMSQVDGRWCFAPYPGQTRWCVGDALRVSAEAQGELLEAHELLDQVHHPTLVALEELGLRMPKEPAAITTEMLRSYLQLVRAAELAKETDLDFWLRRPWRQVADVLRIFDLAILRASAREAA